VQRDFQTTLPGGQHRVNTWRGNFPNENRSEDGFDRASPMLPLPANASTT
jgi:sulfatase modifying factor 1